MSLFFSPFSFLTHTHTQKNKLKRMKKRNKKALNIQIVRYEILSHHRGLNHEGSIAFPFLLFNFHFTIISFSFSFGNENRRSTIYFVCSEFGAKYLSLPLLFVRSACVCVCVCSPGEKNQLLRKLENTVFQIRELHCQPG